MILLLLGIFSAFDSGHVMGNRPPKEQAFGGCAFELFAKLRRNPPADAPLLYDASPPLGIKTETLNIVNLAFEKAFNAAIEAKVTDE